MKVRVHLSRLRTDTQVQNTKQMKNGESTSAPVTSVDRHTSTKKLKMSGGNFLDLSQQRKRKRRASVKT